MNSLQSIQSSPLQRPLLKPPSFDSELSPIILRPIISNENPTPLNLLDSTSRMSSVQVSEALPSAKPAPLEKKVGRARRAFTNTVNNISPLGSTIDNSLRLKHRNSSIHPNGNITRSILEPSTVVETSFSINSNIQLDLSFQNNYARRDSFGSKGRRIAPMILTPLQATPNPQGSPVIRELPENRDPPMIRGSPLHGGSPMSRGSPANRGSPTGGSRERRVGGVTRARCNSGEGKIKLQSILSGSFVQPIEERKSDIKRFTREMSAIRQVLGETNDNLKVDRFVKYLENTMKRIYALAENKKNDKDEVAVDKTKPSDNKSALAKDFKLLRKGSRISGNESTELVKEEDSLVKENRREELLEYLFYREVNDTIQYCARENIIPVFLKTIKLLGNLYFHYGKLDEAFHCFHQLRTASEYLGMYKVKATAYYKMAECCKQVDNYDEAIKLLRKSLQYAWDINLTNLEIKIYNTLGKIYYLQGTIKKAQYYSERFTRGEIEPKDSPLREYYSTLLQDNQEKGRYGHYTNIDPDVFSKISLPALPFDYQRKASFTSTISSSSIEDQQKKELRKRPRNVRTFIEQMIGMMADSEIVIEKKSDLDSSDNEIQEKIELPSPTYKTNFAEFESRESHEQKIREIRLKEERLTNVIKNAKRELAVVDGDEDRKQRLNNIIQLQIAFQREKRLILGHQQAYRIHLAQMWKKEQYSSEITRKPSLVKVNMKRDSQSPTEDRETMILQDTDVFQEVKNKVKALRFQNNLPPFSLLTHKKSSAVKNKKDKSLLNEGAKKIYFKYHKKIMKKIAPNKTIKVTRGESM